MGRWRTPSLSLSLKLQLVAMLTVFFAVGSISALLMVRHLHAAKDGLVRELQTAAEVIGINSVEAVNFGDQKVAQENLSAIKSKSFVAWALIKLPDGEVFARYAGADIAPTHDGALPLFEPELEVAVPIFSDGAVIADVVLHADTGDILRAATREIMVVSFACALIMLAAMLAVRQMLKSLYAPVTALYEDVRGAAQRGDFQVSSQEPRRDEVGVLVEGFDALMRTIKERQESLERARQAAEEANQAKSAFIAAMSHELRTPLNSILGFSEMISSETFGPHADPRYRDFGNDILTSGQHLLEVINSILDLSKVEAGKLELRPAHLLVRRVIDQALLMVRPKANELGHTITVECPAYLPHLYADERLVKQSIINLLGNAVKFTPQSGKITVNVKLARDGGLDLGVRDSGIGIAAADIPIALAPFRQIDSTLARKHEGTGLGLPLVKSFVEIHGGRLSIDSTVGAGTTVTMWFPPERLIMREAPAPAAAVA